MPPTAVAAAPVTAEHTPDHPGDSFALPSRWEGLLVPYDAQAPDGRVFETPPGHPPSRDMPLPLNAQIMTDEGHKSAVLIGTVDRIWSQNGALWGAGRFDLDTEAGRDWAGRVGRRMAGWGSVDLDSESAPRVESRGEGKVPRRIYSDWTFAGYTLVTRPAFDEARIGAVWEPTADDDDERCLRRDPDTGECLFRVGDDDAEADMRVDDPRNGDMPSEVRQLLDDVDLSFLDTADDDIDIAAGCACGGSGEPVSAAVSGKTDLPLADRGRRWDKVAAERRVRAWAGVDTDDPTPAQWSRYGQAFFWHAPDPGTLADFKLPFADVVDGRLTAVPGGIIAAAGAMRGARGGVDLPAADRNAVRARIGGYYTRMDMTPPWDTGRRRSMSAGAGDQVTCGDYAGTVVGYDSEGGWLRIRCGDGNDLICPADEAVTAGQTLTASAGPLAPPRAWFSDPQLDGPTALRLGDDGRLYGHLALWGQCHTAFADTCVVAPRSRSGYAQFHTGEVVTAEGDALPVGKLTVGGGHAHSAAGWRAAAAHYDNTGTAVAVVRAGEDQHGIWVAGALVPEATPTQVASLRRSPLSGDWRRIGGELELVAALAVNTPGFAVPRPRAGMIANRQASLVAAGAVDRAELAQQDRLAAIVAEAVGAALDGYAARQARAAAAAQKIAAASVTLAGCGGCGEGCTCGGDDHNGEQD